MIPRHIYHLPSGPQVSRPTYQSQFTHAQDQKPADTGILDDEESSEQEADVAASPQNLPLTHLTRAQVEQFKLAGIPPNTAIPDPPFPAAPADYRRYGTNSNIEAKKRLRELNVPIHAIPKTKQAQADQRARREQHLGVINALVHRCLETGDYDRASRAWGLLLRAMPDGTDVRKFGRWGIGAEILLRRTAASTTQRDGLGMDSSNYDSNQNDMDLDSDNGEVSRQRYADNDFWIPDHNLETAKQYYQRLIVRHPPTKNLHRGKNMFQVNFYPALFSVWIYQITQRVRKARKQAQIRAASLQSAHYLSTTHVDDNPDISIPMNTLVAIQKQELDDAKELAEQFDGVLQNDPYDTDPELLRLRSMVCQWVADLYLWPDDNGGRDDPSANNPAGRTRLPFDGINRTYELDYAERLFGRAREAEADRARAMRDAPEEQGD